MLPLLHLVKFRGGQRRSHSFLVDVYQVHVRNLLLFSFGLSMARQIFGENIICHAMRQHIEQSYLDTKCLINGTMTGKDPAFHHDYYQWIAIVLLLLAFSIYFPYAVWFNRYGSFINELTTSIKDAESCKQLFKVIQKSKGNNLFWKTCTLEMAYLANLFILVFLLNRFFNQAWSSAQWSWKAVNVLFPESGDCFLNYYSGGDETTGRFTCLLPLNTVYRKVFLVLYGVAIALIILHGLAIVYRIHMVMKLKPKYVNMFWACKIAIRSAEKYEWQQILIKEWNQTKYSEDFCSKVYMETLV